MSRSPVPAGVKVLTVGEISRMVQGLLEEAFPTVWVSGEVSNVARPNSGHVYLTLKDSESQLRTVLYRAVAMRMRFDLRDGMEVIVRGRVSMYLPRGEHQLIGEEVHPKGIGAQELALRQLREKLFRLGYFSPQRKKPLPRFPRRIALITSPTGAAVRDMLEIITRRWPALDVWICPSRVQGEGAAEEIAAALRLLNRLHLLGTLPLDVLILGRGGGSTEDLWEFNEECVAHAIYESAIPVISAVGHEIDITTADLVADFRALTPSQAATTVVPDRLEVLNGLDDLGHRLRAAMEQQVVQGRQRLADLAARRAFRLPRERVRDLEQRLDDWSERLRRAVKQRFTLARERLQATAGQLESLSPLNVLSRGYSLCRREADQVVVRHPSQVKPGERLVTTVEHGTIVSRVEESRATPSQSASLPGTVASSEDALHE